MKRIVLISLVAAVFVGCQDGTLLTDTGLTDTGLETANFLILDGAHGGNVDVFVLPPLVKNPTSANTGGEFGDRAFDPNLEGGVFATICLRTGDPNCEAPQIGADLPMELNELKENYGVSWRTRGFGGGLVSGSVYRIQIFLGDALLAFREVQPIDGLKKKDAVDDDCSKEDIPVCRFKNGSNLRIKVRIETGAACIEFGGDPDNCATEFAEQDETIELTGVATATPTNQGGVLSITSCVPLRDRADPAAGKVDLRTFGPCIEIIPLTEGLEGLATLCDPFTEGELGDLTDDQIARMTVHRHTADDPFAVALAHADGPDCAPAAPELVLELNTLERFVRFARNTWRAVSDRVVAWIEPAPLFARTMFRCNRGGCSGPGDFRSSYMVVQPAEMDFDPGPTGDLGSALVNTTLTAKARLKVTDEGGDPVQFARLTFSVTGGGGLVNGGAGPVMVESNSSGIAEVEVTLGPNPGLNTWEASGIGIGVGAVQAPLTTDLADALPVTLSVGTLEFTATGALVFVGPFDVLVYGGASGSTSFDNKAAAGFGHTVTVLDAIDWDTTSTEFFGSFDVIAVPTLLSGDNTATLAATNGAWGPALTGNIVVSGLHADQHNQGGATQYLENALAYAGAAGGTGFVSLTDCSATVAYTWVPSSAPFGGLTGASCFGVQEITITDATHPVMTVPNVLTDALLSTWNQSLHTFFSAPGGFTVIATGSLPFGGVPAGSPAVLVFSQTP